MKKFICLSLFLLLFLGVLPKSAESEVPEYIVGIIPQYTPVVTHERWAPFCDYLSQKTGVKMKLKLSKSIASFEKELMKGVFDFVYMNPYEPVQAKEEQGYLFLVRDSANPVVGILVVRKDNPVKSVKELNGGKIGFPSPNAFMASLYMRAVLIEQEGISFTPEYLKTHDNVYRHILSGMVIAGGGVKGTLKKQPPEVQEQLRILYETEAIAPHPFSAHPRVPEKLRQDVVAAIFDLSKTEEGRAMLKNIFIPEPIVADYERDYAGLEKLRLEKYWDEDSEE